MEVPSVFPYPVVDIPMDPEDADYAQSFDATSLLFDEDSSGEMRRFFDEYGYIVFRNVLDEQQVEKTKDAMWEIIENINPGISLHPYTEILEITLTITIV